LNWSVDLSIIAIIAFVSTFLFYFIIRKIGFYLHAQANRINSFILNGTMKECGLAGGIALTVFNQEVAIPSLFFAIFTFIYMNWLKFRFRHIVNSDNNKKCEI
jgi:predicted Na+-dependent transporter